MPAEADTKLKFGTDKRFQLELRRRVEEYLRSTGRAERDLPQTYLKTAVIVLGFAAFYTGLVFFASAWWQALPLAILLGLSAALIGFNLQHDGAHRSYSRHSWMNKLMAMALDMLGGSSYLWHWKHNVFHHTYSNVAGHDTDIDLGIIARMTPTQRRLIFHRWQQWYIWLLYGVVALRWQLYGDFEEVLTGRVGRHRVPRPKGWDLATFIAGKLVFFMLVLGLPLLFHPLWVVALFYGVAAITLGLALSVVFQLAHCVEEADFPMPAEDSGRIENAWAVHQVETTVDFARRSKVLAWLLGGLNFQIEHHLFSRINHANYPAISQLVEDTCREYGVRYNQHRSICAGIVSHFRWLRRMGSTA
ncbi:MAG: fatty acid desaturase family protein [Gammaproteobacteria bacterium]